MNPEYFKGLRECCQSDAAFEQMQRILVSIEAERQKKELISLYQSLFGDPSHETIITTTSAEYQQTLKHLIAQQTTELVHSNEQLRREIVDRRWAEQALLESEQRFRALIENATDIIAILDKDGVFRYCSPSTKRILGYTSEQVVGHSALEFVHPADGIQVIEVLQASLSAPHASQPPLEYRVQHYNGSWCVFEAVVTSLIDEPAIQGVVINCHDITERKQAEAELLEMSTALGNAVEGIARLNTEGCYIALNRAYAASLGYQQEEMIGMHWRQTLHSDDISTVIASHQQMRIDGKAQVEVRGLRKDGSIFYKEVVMVAAYNCHDEVIGHYCFTRDITDRWQAEEFLRLQTERERLITGIAQRIRTSLNLEEILNTTALEVRQFLRADRVVIYHLDGRGDGVVTAESVEAGFSSMLGLRLTETWSGQLQENYNQGKNLVIDDLSVDPQRYTSPLLNQLQIRALLVVPILYAGQLWGTLAVHQCNVSRHWEPFETSLLEQLATQVAIAIQQSELYRQVQQLNAELEQQVQERTTQLQQALQFEALLKRITDAVRDSLDEDRILQTAVQELALGLEVNGCDAALYNLEEQTSTICYEYICADLPSSKGNTLAMSSLEEIYTQLQQEKYIQFCRSGEGMIRDTVRKFAMLACPIIDDQGAIGDIWLFKPTADTFTHAEIRLVQQVANQCAIAIRQARLFQTAQAQVAALETLNQLKDDFLSTVSHELRTPMSNMKMAIHMMRVTPFERQERYLDILQSECTREIELINDLLDLQRLEASSYPVSLHRLDLEDFLPGVVEPFYSRAGDRQQQLNLGLPDKLPQMITDQVSLERILAELLNNACKYTPPAGRINLTIATEHATTGSFLRVEVGNEAEIAAPEIPRIFEKFYRIPNSDPWKQGGTGLGLALIQRLVIQLGGTIKVMSEQGWTRFTVLLPLTDHLELS